MSLPVIRTRAVDYYHCWIFGKVLHKACDILRIERLLYRDAQPNTRKQENLDKNKKF